MTRINKVVTEFPKLTVDRMYLSFLGSQTLRYFFILWASTYLGYPLATLISLKIMTLAAGYFLTLPITEVTSTITYYENFVSSLCLGLELSVLAVYPNFLSFVFLARIIARLLLLAIDVTYPTSRKMVFATLGGLLGLPAVYRCYVEGVSTSTTFHIPALVLFAMYLQLHNTMVQYTSEIEKKPITEFNSKIVLLLGSIIGFLVAVNTGQVGRYFSKVLRDRYFINYSTRFLLAVFKTLIPPILLISVDNYYFKCLRALTKNKPVLYTTTHVSRDYHSAIVPPIDKILTSANAHLSSQHCPHTHHEHMHTSRIGKTLCEISSSKNLYRYLKQKIFNDHTALSATDARAVLIDLICDLFEVSVQYFFFMHITK